MFQTPSIAINYFYCISKKNSIYRFSHPYPYGDKNLVSFFIRRQGEYNENCIEQYKLKEMQNITIIPLYAILAFFKTRMWSLGSVLMLF